ncbi:hypothetical protein ACN38_g3492 [Penicillium nordicum]|uniref:Uncharacterized protein n=1 Tax=Penicillium nordicum TaxID=229535 RepID=A0A0M8PC58_9EURO|nr:hypothetical protein ACN38_g3492 [Penicillium nordicum]
MYLLYGVSIQMILILLGSSVAHQNRVGRVKYLVGGGPRVGRATIGCLDSFSLSLLLSSLSPSTSYITNLHAWFLHPDSIDFTIHISSAAAFTRALKVRQCRTPGLGLVSSLDIFNMALNYYDISAIRQEINRAPRAKAQKCPMWELGWKREPRPVRATKYATDT